MQKVHYSLRESLLKIIIKGSFTENFYPLKAFSSGEFFLVPLWVVFFFFFEKIKNKTLQNGFFFLMKRLYIERVVQL